MKTFVASVCVAVVSVTFFATFARASMLTFDVDPTPDESNPVGKLFGTTPTTTNFPDYGDRISWSGSPSVVDQDVSAARSQPANTTVFHYSPLGGQTPNIVVDYNGVNGSGNSGFPPYDGGEYFFQHSGMNGGSPVARAYYNSNDLKRYITITADSGYAVILNSFQLATFDTESFRYLRVVGIADDNSESTIWSVGDPITGNVTVNNPTYNSADFGTSIFHAFAIDFQPSSSLIHIYYGLDNIEFTQFVPEPASLATVALASVGLLARRSRRD
jgi:hypothetical protein